MRWIRFPGLLFCFRGKQRVRLFGSAGRTPVPRCREIYGVAAPRLQSISAVPQLRCTLSSLKGLFFGELYACNKPVVWPFILLRTRKGFCAHVFHLGLDSDKGLSGDRILYWKHRDLPGGSVAKTPCCQCKETWFDPWLGN